MGLHEESANDVVGCANETFSLAVLGRGGGACEAKGDAVGGEEVTKGRVNELTAIVTLHAFNHYAKLCMKKCKETLENGGRVKFVT